MKKILKKNIKRSLNKKSKRNRKFRRNKCRFNINRSPNLYNNKTFRYKYTEENLKTSSVVIDTPSVFNIITNTDQFINFIIDLKKTKHYNNNIKYVTIDFSKVTSLEQGSISILLSVIEELSFYNIECFGNYPNDQLAREKLLKSGFNKHIEQVSKDLKKADIDTENLIIRTRTDTVDGEMFAEIIHKTTKFLTGEEMRYQPLYTILMELAPNSIEHAYKNQSQIHWFIGLNFDEINRKVIFTFADNGKGILNTIYRNPKKKIADLISVRDSAEILDRVFEKEYNSRLKQDNRNKGLPIIKQFYLKGYIKNLKVLTNRGFIEYDSERFTSIKKNYSGTFFYWEINETCLKNK